MNTARLKTAAGLIDQLTASGGSLRLDGDTIKARLIPADLLPELRAFKPEILAILQSGCEPPAPAIAPRPIVLFTLTEGGGAALGQPTDTPASLLADLIERWPNELKAAWCDGRQIYPKEAAR